MFILFFFFFSSRRRHTRCHGDWSSDVCSSDLPGMSMGMPHQQPTIALPGEPKPTTLSGAAAQAGGTMPPPAKSKAPLFAIGALALLLVGGGGAFLALRGGDKDKTAVASEEPTAVTPTPEPAAAPTPEPPAPAPTPAPESAPAPEPAPPPQPEKASISIESTPAAEIFVGNEKKARGKTPYTLELDKGAAPVEIKLLAKGYHTETRKVSPDDGKVAVKLTKRGRPQAATSSTATSTPANTTTTTTTDHSDDTMNPFASQGASAVINCPIHQPES